MKLHLFIISILFVLGSCGVGQNQNTRLPAAYSIDDGNQSFKKPMAKASSNPESIDTWIKDYGFLAITSNESCQNKQKMMDLIWMRAHRSCKAHGHEKAVSFKVSPVKDNNVWLVNFKNSGGKIDVFYPTACKHKGRKIANTKPIAGPNGIQLWRAANFTAYPKKFKSLECI